MVKRIQRKLFEWLVKETNAEELIQGMGFNSAAELFEYVEREGKQVMPECRRRFVQNGFSGGKDGN